MACEDVHDLSLPYIEGWWARIQHQNRADNPYSDGLESSLWNDGYDDVICVNPAELLKLCREIFENE